MKRKPTVAVDLDGVLSEYNGWKGVDHFGDPIPGSIEFTLQLQSFARVLIFTTRGCADPSLNREGLTPQQLKDKITHWLDTHGFFYDDVYVGQGKPIASAYIDDRAVNCQPQKLGPQQYELALNLTRLFTLGEQDGDGKP